MLLAAIVFIYAIIFSFLVVSSTYWLVFPIGLVAMILIAAVGAAPLVLHNKDDAYFRLHKNYHLDFTFYMYSLCITIACVIAFATPVYFHFQSEKVASVAQFQESKLNDTPATHN